MGPSNEDHAHRPPINWDTDPDDVDEPLNPMPVVLANSPKDSHDQPNDRNNPSFPFSSVHVTRSQITKSSSPVPVSVALDPFRFPVSVAEKDSVICRLNLQIELLEREIAQTKAELRASNAHCTLMTRAASEVMTSLENQKRKTRRSAKTSARYLTQKATEDAARKVRIRSEIAARTFSDPLASYKRKDDLIALSGALGLQMTGTVTKLVAQIKSHLAANPDIQQDPRFSGLFQQRRRQRVEPIH